MSTYTPSAVRLASMAIPDDTLSARNASSVNVPLEALADDAAWVKASLVSQFIYTHDPSDIPLGGSYLETFISTGSYASATNALLTVAGASVGDVLLFEATFLAGLVNNVDPVAEGHLRLYTTQQFGGGAPVTAAAPGAYVYFYHNATIGGADAFLQNVHMGGQLVIASAGSVQLSLRGKVSDATEPLLVSHAVIRATLIRKVSS